MRVLIYGLGRSGRAAAALCRSQGHDILYFDQREHGPDVDELHRAGAIRLEPTATPGGAFGADERIDICIAAPGVPIDHPDLASLRERGVETIGEVEWVFRTVSRDMVGITGTAGKGTVTRWLADTLERAGRDVSAGGNIDPALSEVARPDATHVVELSSFQLERCPTLRPQVAVILNLGSDHLDRHGDVASYHAAKRNLLANLGPDELFVYNADDPILASWARETTARVAGFSLLEPAAAQLTADGVLRLAGNDLLHVDELQVRGSHHQANALAVALAAQEVGLDHEEIVAGLRSFSGLPGRYSDAGRIGNVSFIEDSIATRELSVKAALAATQPPVVWIAGGRSKGASVAGLEDLVRERVRLFIGVGESGAQLAHDVGRWVSSQVCSDSDGKEALRNAVRAALRHLAVHSPQGGTVLLAPLASSFDQFSDYRERAEAFRQVVREEGAEWILSS